MNDSSLGSKSEHNVKLDCLIQVESPPRIVRSSATRDWMDSTHHRNAYRCTPLSIANAAGWEILSPVDFTVHWNGGNRKGDLNFQISERKAFEYLLSSTFGYGILTLHPGYVFRTDPGWNLWVRGSPNRVKDGIQPLDGIVETNWLPFSFTMNWKFTRPGSVTFHKDEPFCFITPHQTLGLEAIQPLIRRIEDEPEFSREVKVWSDDRRNHNEWLATAKNVPKDEAWQKYYLNGKSPTAKVRAGDDHRVKLILKDPLEKKS